MSPFSSGIEYLAVFSVAIDYKSCSIFETQLDVTADLYAQVSSLVSLRLLERASTADNIDSVRLRVRCLTKIFERRHKFIWKYKPLFYVQIVVFMLSLQCLATLADVKRVADSVAFELFKYLHDTETV